MIRHLASALALAFLAGFTACGEDTLLPDAGLRADASSASGVESQGALPACLLGNGLLDSASVAVEACAGAPCLIEPPGISGSLSERWLYCVGACSADCLPRATVNIYNGRVISVGRTPGQPWP